MSTVGGGVNIVTNGLVLYLDASNTKSYVSGSTTWNDVSRSGNNGTLVNGPTFNSENGGSIVFDGTNELVQGSGISNITAFTISIWFKMTGPGSTGGVNIIYNSLFGINSGNRRILVSNSTNTGETEGRILVQMGGSNYFSDNNSSGLTITNSWNNVVYTFSSNVATLYINGIIQTTQSNSSVTFPDDNIYLGAYNNPITAYAMKGNISQSSVYNRALSASEVLQNYNATKSRFGL
jgi:hypothetical protein